MAEDEPAELRLIDPRSLAGQPIPIREWIVEDWLPVGTVTLNYGDGGVGKTLLAQQLATACAAGTYWGGLTVKRCRVLALFCEDDTAEVHRRQARINDAFGLEWADLGDLQWACPVAQDNALARFRPDGTWDRTERYNEVKAAAKAHGAGLLVLDTAADLFAGNENDRQHVRAFLGPVLTGLAQELKAAVLLNAHPSRSGLSGSGDMDGGSTAWSNTARSRWALTRPAAEEGSERNVNCRILTRRKANYASIGDTIRLQWRDGVLLPQTVSAGATGAPARAAAEKTFLTLLERTMAQGQNVSASINASNYAPKLFASRPDASGLTKRDFTTAMQALFASNRIRVAEYGRSGKERHRIEPELQKREENP